MKILCVCNGNAFRSQIFAALLIQRCYEADSCGITPCKEIHWKTKATLWEYNKELLNLLTEPKIYNKEFYDHIIFLSEESYFSGIEFLGSLIYQYYLPDPMPEGSREDFVFSYVCIVQAVDRFIKGLVKNVN